ncbi:hypothetical protein [Sphingomonas sp. ID0503]|uniref:hypothetical protein n=1 Tax=Sphingomonas sp. ID0503 TaxID=3399691 RepID=UPI003AFB7C99
MVKNLTFAAAIAASILLAGCDKAAAPAASGNQTDADALGENFTTAADVKLPPALKASKTYRCADASLVFVDFYTDDTSAAIKTEKEGAATPLTAAAAGGPFTAEGFSVSGSGTPVEIAVPGKKAQTCKA